MEVPDVRVMNLGERPRRYSGKLYIPDPDEIEKITVAPSTELIPDEYEHEDNKKGLVSIFYSNSDKGNMEMLREALSDQHYDVPDANVYKTSTKESVLNDLTKIAKLDYQDRTCFILVFMGNVEREDQFLPDEEEDMSNCISIKDVWSLFTSDNCPSLKYKPKVFIFQASKKIEMVTFDSRAMNTNHPVGAYDIPAEADMLLVYKKVEVPWIRNHFIEQLCNNFHDYGHKDDVIGLVTHTDHQDNKRPLIISTLTRKFYVRSSNQRGHHYDLHKNHDTVIEMLQELNTKIKTIQEQQSAFKKRFEQKSIRKWPEPSAVTSSNVTQGDDFSVKKEAPKAELSESRKVSRAPSSASSVDSKRRLKKTVMKPRDPWKY